MMNNEEFERKAAFIVNQQAQFAVDMDKLRQRQDKTEESIDRLVAAQARTEEELTYLAAAQRKTEEVVTRLAYVTNEGFKDVNAKIDSLVNSQIALEDSHRETDKQLRQTGDEVRKLTATVDRYIRRRNGD